MYQEEYRRKLMSADDAASLVKSGDTVYIAGGALTPVDFAAALQRQRHRLSDVQVLNYLPLAPLELLLDPENAGRFQVESLFFNRVQQKTAAYGYCDFIPNHLRNAVRDWGTAVPEYDLMVVTVSPMDRHGYFTLTASALIEQELMGRAKKIVAEVASHAPRCFGDTLVHISQLDGLIESDRYPTTLPQAAPTHEDELLGGYVSELVEDGSTIQLGFGGTIDALAMQLRNKKDLGIHTEAFSDAGMELIQCGAVTNRKKTLYPGLTLTSFTMGSCRLYDYINDNPGILHKALSHTNDPRVISQNRKMVSINAALQIDLTGQCASESIGPRQFSGSGGQVDTAVGAQMSEGGKSIITLRSTYYERDAATGEKMLKSRIVPMLTPGSAVTLTRTNTHFVATEYGAVCLRGLTLHARAKALISIAHPDFRDWLREEFERVYRLKL